MNKATNLKWYEFSQNNSGGYFNVDDKVCHRLFIEAYDYDEAKAKAEKLGCYWYGVSKGLDCPCCGDRWSDWKNEIDLEKLKTKGYKVTVYEDDLLKATREWNIKYSRYKIIKELTFQKGYSVGSFVGTIGFDCIEEYVQFLANKHGMTKPDARLYYANGSVKEIYSTRF